MADKLQLYNMALGHLEQRKLASLAENREPRRVLDDYWDQEVAYCLERKAWNFTYRTVQLDASLTVVPVLGFRFAFEVPADRIRTHKLSAVESLDPPLLQVVEEAGFWYANIAPIYVQYTSRDPLFGLDLGRWPASFTDYVSLRLARKACKRITGSSELLDGPTGLIRQEADARKVAAANCAMNDPVGFPPQSGWVRSRRHAGFGRDFPTGGSLVP